VSITLTLLLSFLNEWSHIAITYSATTGRAKIYINGSLDVSEVLSSSTIDVSASDLKITYDNPPNSYDGIIDELKIYNRVLSDEEINVSYNNTLYRLYHNFTNLQEGTDEYYAYSVDRAGNSNQTETRILTVDLTKPSFFDNSTNSTCAGFPIEFRLRWTDNFGLSGYIFSFDNCTGNFVNDTWKAMSGTENWTNVTKVINETLGCKVRWKVYANDTANNWRISQEFSFITPAASDPFISNSFTLTFLGEIAVGDTIYIYANGYSPNGTTSGEMPLIDKRSSKTLTLDSPSGKFNFTLSWFEYYEKKSSQARFSGSMKSFRIWLLCLFTFYLYFLYSGHKIRKIKTYVLALGNNEDGDKPHRIYFE
jgi:hypothetical protein